MRIPISAAAIAAGVLALVASAATAQTVEELVVMGHKGKEPQTFSYKVTFHDIDLRHPAGVKELNRRVEVTADYVCYRLGQTGGAGAPCRSQAIADAQPGVQKAVKAARLSTKNWHKGPAWKPPPAYKS
jgi:UrcA family protein